MKKVRVNSVYRYEPVPMDRISPHLHGRVEKGDQVRVVNMPGCPKANVMGQCYIQNMDGKFIGMVCTNSLEQV